MGADVTSAIQQEPSVELTEMSCVACTMSVLGAPPRHTSVPSSARWITSPDLRSATQHDPSAELVETHDAP